MTDNTSLSSDSWLRTLEPGSQVWWNDLDRGVSAGYFYVVEILASDGVESGNTVLLLQNDAGHDALAYAHELSQMQPENARDDSTTSYFLKQPLKLSFTVEVRDCGSGFDVVMPDGRRCDGLGWDEMLGQVAHLTHPNLGAPRYAMRTPEEWAAYRAEIAKR